MFCEPLAIINYETFIICKEEHEWMINSMEITCSCIETFHSGGRFPKNQKVNTIHSAQELLTHIVSEAHETYKIYKASSQGYIINNNCRGRETLHSWQCLQVQAWAPTMQLLWSVTHYREEVLTSQLLDIKSFTFL